MDRLIAKGQLSHEDRERADALVQQASSSSSLSKAAVSADKSNGREAGTRLQLTAENHRHNDGSSGGDYSGTSTSGSDEDDDMNEDTEEANSPELLFGARPLGDEV